jgi:hypothetical protein
MYVYKQAYNTVIKATYATTRAIAFSFAVLNRTVWTARKQFLSGDAGGLGNGEDRDPDDGNCILCGEQEDTAHILTNCDAYSYRLWEIFNAILTETGRQLDPQNGLVSLNFLNIM